MAQKKSVTLPELIKALGALKVRQAIVDAGGTCDESLPRKWARGQRPSWRNVDALEALANKNGMTLSILGVQK